MSTFADAPQVAAAPGSLRGSTAAPEAVTAEVTKNGGTPELAEDGYPKDMEIPIRYVKGMEGDMVEARRRWIATLKVRVEISAACFGTTTCRCLMRLLDPIIFSISFHESFCRWCGVVGVYLCGSRWRRPLLRARRRAVSSLVTSAHVEPRCRHGW